MHSKELQRSLSVRVVKIVVRNVLVQLHLEKHPFLHPHLVSSITAFSSGNSCILRVCSFVKHLPAVIQINSVSAWRIREKRLLSLGDSDSLYISTALNWRPEPGAWGGKLSQLCSTSVLHQSLLRARLIPDQGTEPPVDIELPDIESPKCNCGRRCSSCHWGGYGDSIRHSPGTHAVHTGMVKHCTVRVFAYDYLIYCSIGSMADTLLPVSTRIKCPFNLAGVRACRLAMSWVLLMQIKYPGAMLSTSYAVRSIWR